MWWYYYQTHKQLSQAILYIHLYTDAPHQASRHELFQPPYCVYEIARSGRFGKYGGGVLPLSIIYTKKGNAYLIVALYE